MKAVSWSPRWLIAGSMVAVMPLLLAFVTPAGAEAVLAGSCDATGTDHCCICQQVPGGDIACDSYAGNDVWSCTSEFCSTTGCDVT